MKKRIYIGVCLLLPFLSACNDWLDVSPKSEIKADELFETEAGFKDALTGLYIGMTDQSVYGANLSWQEIEWMAGQYTETNNSFAELQKCNYESSIAKSFIESVWSKEYNIIAETNLLLESLEENGNMLNPTLYNVIKGEALAIRAMCHFDLIRLFAKGNFANRPEILSELCVPYVTAYSKETTGQLSYEATLALLHQDIEDALECLQSDPLYTGEIDRPDDYDAVTDDIFFEGTYYKGRETRLSYPAVLLLNARVYLWEGNKEKALEYAEDLMEAYDIYVANGDKDWATENNNIGGDVDAASRDYVFQGELLFALDVQKLEDYLNGAYSETVGGNHNYDRLFQNTDFVTELFGSLNTSDLRFRGQWETAGSTGYLTVKVRKTQDNYYANYVPLMRISEAYLIAAECLMDTDKPAAVGLMNYLKEKRNIPPTDYLPEDISLEDLRAEIIQDYRREFCQEGQLFFCYKRLGLTTFTGMVGNEMTDAQYRLPYPDIENELAGRQ